MSYKRFPFLFISLLFLLFPLSGLGASVHISTDAPGNKIGVGETFHITIEARNCAGNIDISQLPPGVKFVYNTSQSSTHTSVVNGKAETVTSTSMILTCKGETPGTYTYGPVAVNGVKSNTINYTVTAEAQGGNNADEPGSSSGTSGSTGHPSYDPNSGPVFVGKGNEDMFMRAQVNKTTAYEQEAIEYTVKLYSSYAYIKFLGAAAAPKFDGFVMDESDDVSKSLVFEQYNGKTYSTAIIARYIIFPQKSGKLTVKGNTYTVSTDAREYYNDPYFQQMVVKRPIQLNITPNDVVINVKSLPQPIPANFIGGVGNFSLSSSMPSRNLSTNNPGSLVFTVTGSGNIKYVKLPDLAQFFPKSVELYTPEIQTDVNIGSSNVSGKVTFDYPLVPKEAGSLTIPSLKFSYFDPSVGQYRELSTTPFQINVSLGKASANSQQTASFNPELLPVGSYSQEMLHLYVKSPLYWLWFGVPVVIFIVSLFGYRKYLHDHEDLTLLRSKKANKMALKRLAKAYKCYQNHQEEQFYDEMLAALWGYIGDKLKMPTSELNRGNVSEEFKKHGVQESTFMPIINLIDECEYAKYTPVSRDANMRQLYADAVKSLAEVESEYDKQTGQTDADEDVSADDSSSSNYVNTQDLNDTK